LIGRCDSAYPADEARGMMLLHEMPMMLVYLIQWACCSKPVHLGGRLKDGRISKMVFCQVGERQASLTLQSPCSSADRRLRYLLYVELALRRYRLLDLFALTPSRRMYARLRVHVSSPRVCGNYHALPLSQLFSFPFWCPQFIVPVFVLLLACFWLESISV